MSAPKISGALRTTGARINTIRHRKVLDLSLAEVKGENKDMCGPNR